MWFPKCPATIQSPHRKGFLYIFLAFLVQGTTNSIPWSIQWPWTTREISGPLICRWNPRFLWFSWYTFYAWWYQQTWVRGWRNPDICPFLERAILLTLFPKWSTTGKDSDVIQDGKPFFAIKTVSLLALEAKRTIQRISETKLVLWENQ